MRSVVGRQLQREFNANQGSHQMKTSLSPRRQLKLKRKVDKFLLGLTKDVDELLFARNCAVRHVEDVLLAASPQADREDADPEAGVSPFSSKRLRVVSAHP